MSGDAETERSQYFCSHGECGPCTNRTLRPPCNTVTKVPISLFERTSSPSFGLTLTVIFFSPAVGGIYFRPEKGTRSVPSGTVTRRVATGKGWSSTYSSISSRSRAKPWATSVPLTSSTFFTYTVGPATTSRRAISFDFDPALGSPKPTVYTGIDCARNSRARPPAAKRPRCSRRRIEGRSPRP